MSIRDEKTKNSQILPIEGYRNMPLVSLEIAVEPLMTLLPSIQTYVSLAKEKCQNPADDLTCDQSASIMLYAMRWQPIDQCLSYVLNIILCSNDRDQLKPWFLYLKLLLTALCRLPPIQDTIIYRGIQSDMSKQYQKNQKIIWWDFALCTRSSDKINLNKNNVRTIFTIECKSCKDISKHLFNPTTDMILLFPATQFQVIQNIKQRANGHSIQLKEIESPFQFLQPVLIVSDLKQFGNFKPSIINEHRHNRKSERVTFEDSSKELKLKNISNDDMKIIIKQEIREKQCTELWLNNAQITSQSALLLSNSLFNNLTLIKLYLNDNSLQDRGVYCLSRVLTINNRTLKELYLARNNITSKGAEYLSEMLNVNCTLTTLCLYGNKITDEGIKYLTHVLTYYNTTLEYLYLSGNNLMTDLSIDYLIKMFEKNQTLKRLHLFNCNLSKIGKMKLQEIAQTKQNFTLYI